MNHFDICKLYTDLRANQKKVYVSLAAQDNFNNKDVNMDCLFLEEDIKDETDGVIPQIESYIKQIVLHDFTTGNDFDSFYVKFTPLLFYRTDTIDSDPDKIIAETKYLDYYGEYVRLMIDFVTIKERVEEVTEFNTETGKEETITKRTVEENYLLRDNPIIATVDYHNFVKKCNALGYGLNYQSYYELARAILKCALEDDTFPDLFITVFDNESTKRYQEDAKIYEQSKRNYY